VTNIVFAKQTGYLSQFVFVRKGDAWDADDPVVKRFPNAFSPDPEEYVHRSVKPEPRKKEQVIEQATAAPGEKRRGRPRKESPEAS